jgi:putative membrane protein insertion efficiency factor
MPMRDFAKLVVLQLLRGYKWVISPMLPPACRFVPTCSEYAMEAVDRYGPLRGGVKALARLMRCHPFAKGGYDPLVKNRHADSCCERPFLACLEPREGTNDQRPTTNDERRHAQPCSAT